MIDLTAAVASEPDGALAVRLTGELDLATARLLTECVDTALLEGERDIVIDLRDVSFIDSRGLRALLKADRETNARGGQLVIRCPSTRALDLFVMTGLDRVLTIQQYRPDQDGP